MPEELVHKVLYELAAIKYNGRIAFHFFNEVFTDNRIFSFFEKCKELYLSKDQLEKVNLKEGDYQIISEYIRRKNKKPNE